MALQLAHTLESDIVVATAYHRIFRFSGGTPDLPIEVQVYIYKDVAARQAGKSPAAVATYKVPYDVGATGTTLANLYAGLKLLPEYAGAGNV